MSDDRMFEIAECPECGAPLEVVDDGQVGVPYMIANGGQEEWRLEARPFAACTGCEFCLEIHP